MANFPEIELKMYEIMELLFHDFQESSTFQQHQGATSFQIRTEFISYSSLRSPHRETTCSSLTSEKLALAQSPLPVAQEWGGALFVVISVNHLQFFQVCSLFSVLVSVN